MEELIFFAVIIFFSIVESMVRRRKAKQGGHAEDGTPHGTLPEEWDVEGSRPRAPLPTYDDDPSYDDVATRGSGQGVGTETTASGRASASGSGETLERYARPHGADRARADRPGEPGDRTHTEGRGRPSSETMLPGDLLEELQGLAGRLEQQRSQERRRREGRPVDQRQAPRRVEVPDRSPPLPAPLERTEVGSRGSEAGTAPIRDDAISGPFPGQHRIHDAHAGYGTDPSSRARSEQDGLDPLAERLSDDALAVRRQLLSHKGSALRRAIILKEVLGPPVVLRDERIGG